MPPADEATFIALWQQGLTMAAIAVRLDRRQGDTAGCPRVGKRWAKS
jgi:hypothetical protein